METADAALYYAKTKGGNQSYIHAKIPAQPPTMVRQETVGISLNAIYALTSVVEARDHYTYGHSRKVNHYAVALAKALELPNDEITKISASASLHDVGKIGITDDILNKKGKFTEADWRIIKAHSKLGASIIGSVPGLVPCIPAILYHHEHYDGSGYPEGLKGDEIPRDARIMAIADAFSAMTSVRPYRGALSVKKAIEELERNAGTQFDPKLLEVFINVVKSEGFEKETTETKK
jgi:HD-GYP domain-containing protein (c-di-GMP phosphodiesterase class II)